MLENFIYIKQKDLFIDLLEAGNVLDEAIVFIEDTKEIWNHGTYFNGSKVDLSKLEEAISKIKTDGNGFTYLNDKGEYEIPLIIVDSEEELNSITPEIGTQAVVRNIVEGYDNLNLFKILNEEETNVPSDLFDNYIKYTFKITSVDTSILFPYLLDEEYRIYKLLNFNAGLEELEIRTNLDGSSISGVYLYSLGARIPIYVGDTSEFYWQDSTILEYIIPLVDILNVKSKDQNVVNAFLLFSTALNVSIIANNEHTNYCYTSKGWILRDYITEQLLLIFGFNMLSNFSEQIPNRVSQLVNDSNYITKTEVADSYLPIGDYATKTEIPTKVSELENDANYVQDDVVSDGVYAVDANGKLIDYNSADATATGVALVAGEHKFMIAKSDATDGSNYNLYYDYDKGDLSLTNYSTADGTNSYGYLGGSSTPQLSQDFTTWTEGALSDFNGKSNTQVIAASSSNAKDMCKVLETFNAGSDNQGHTDWYVPACGQLALMCLAKTDINAALAKIGGTAFESDYYWSSSEYDASNAWYVRFGNGRVTNGNGKNNNTKRVRFVRDISIPKSLKERVDDLESSNCAYKEINHGTGDTTFALTPNTFHVWDEVATLDLSFEDETDGVANEYTFQFTSGATPTSLTLPDTIQWVNGAPNIEANKTYQISIVNNIGLIVSV